LDPCDDQGVVTIASDGGSHEFLGCQDSFIRLDVIAANENVLHNLTITDSDGTFLVRFFSQSDDAGFSVASNGHNVSVDSGGGAQLNIAYAGMPFTSSQDEAKFGNGSIVVDQLVPNSHRRHIFHGVGNNRLDIKWDFLEPSSGFVALQATNGRLGILAAKMANDTATRVAVRMEDAVAGDGFSMSVLDVVTQNTLASLQRQRVTVTYSLGELTRLCKIFWG
jgi:hypothetical protein